MTFTPPSTDHPFGLLTMPLRSTEPNMGYVVPFLFTPEQRAFLARHDIGCSDGYIGMLRAYCGNRTVWQTSAWAPIGAAMSGKADLFPAINAANVKALHAWVNDLMALPAAEVTERLAGHVPLLS